MSGKPPNIVEALSRAKSLEKSGILDQAEEIYQTVLKHFPANKRAKKRLNSVKKALAGKGRAGSSGVTPAAMTPPDEVSGLVSLFNQGRMREAFERGVALTRKFPGDSAVHNMLGVISARVGQTRTALTAYEHALAIKPDFAEALNNRGNLLSRLRHHKEAISSFRKALQVKPNYAEAHNGLGSALHDAGEPDKAVASYRKALRFRADYFEARNNLGNALAAQGQHELALENFSKAIRLKPDFSQAHFNRGNTLRHLGGHDEAIAAFSRAVELNHDYAEAYNGLGNTLIEQGRFKHAIDALGRAIKLKPDYVEAHCNLGNALSDFGRPEEALSSYRAALAISPGFAEGHCNLGNALTGLGRVDEAIASYEQALQLRPDFVAVFNNLSQIKSYQNGDPQIARMQQLLSDPGISEDDKMHLDFALGKVNDDLGNVNLAFKHFEAGNHLKKSALGYNIEQDRVRFEQIKSLYTALKYSKPQGIEAGQEIVKHPILVIGMPRSGTTLVEQILASHSQVFGAGELEVLDRSLNPVLQKVTADGPSGIGADVLVHIRNNYLEELGQVPATEPYVIDKMPGNFKWIGFLLMVMPELKIINLQRDPVATCWSIFRHHFAGRGNGYAYDLADIAGYYRIYIELMDFWRKEFPGRIHDLNYELLTENQEQQTRALLDYCGLDWEEQCLEFYKSAHNVKTLSSQQVRKGMYTGSSQAWRKYETHLQLLQESLET